MPTEKGSGLGRNLSLQLEEITIVSDHLLSIYDYAHNKNWAQLSSEKPVCVLSEVNAVTHGCTRC